MMRFFLIAVAIVVAVVFVINGAYMMISPRAWFRLPGWLGATGSLREEK